MTPTLFASFKYQHDGDRRISPARWRFIAVGVAVAAVAGFFSQGPALVLLVVPLIAWVAAPRLLQLGPRYLICGREILYYSNVSAAMLERKTGRLRLQCSGGESFLLEREKFPTGARKADKIARNKAAKFDKLASKLIEKVRRVAPSAQIDER